MRPAFYAGAQGPPKRFSLRRAQASKGEGWGATPGLLEADDVPFQAVGWCFGEQCNSHEVLILTRREVGVSHMGGFGSRWPL